ncbi:MAG TPA: PaaI family thioesterase [Bacteroidales bacterium]|nr:PaaI family thioesterase [Bacteroidales bacterium]
MANRKIKNPFTTSETYNCFGCSPRNQIGLQLEFEEEGDWITAEWTPKRDYEGWFNVLHGGLQTTLLDELGSWVVFVKMGTAGVTSKLEIKFIKPVHVDKGTVRIKGRIKEIRRNIAIIEALLYGGDGELCAVSTMHYFAFAQEKAREMMMLLGPQAFFKND